MAGTVARVRIGTVTVWGERNRPPGVTQEVVFVENGKKTCASMKLSGETSDVPSAEFYWDNPAIDPWSVGFVYERDTASEWWNRYA